MLGIQLALAGLLFMSTPIIAALLDGARSSDDLDVWLGRLTLGKMITLAMMGRLGLLLLTCSVVAP